MKKILKITFISFGCLILAFYLGQNTIVDLLVGKQKSPEYSSLSSSTQQLVDSLFDFDLVYRDCHTHVVGVNPEQTGCYVNKNLNVNFSPVDNFKFKIYKKACAIKSDSTLDEDYIDRLINLKEGLPFQHKSAILAFDKYYSKDGRVMDEYTHLYVPNDYVVKIANQYSEHFIPCISINPYRKDALTELDKYGKLGVQQLKWLPNSMGINPGDSSIIPFYEKMKEYKITLLTHCGHEHSVDTHIDQNVGNPQLLELPLSLGVKVIVAHCASVGTNTDKYTQQERSNFEMFADMMNNKDYEGLLFADISATTLINRENDVLEELLKNQTWHKRLIQGSDYPIPAIGVLINHNQLIEKGLIEASYTEELDELKDHNSLLYEMTLKRLLKHNGNSFNMSIFSEP